MDELAQQFEQQLWETIRVAKSLGYYPTKFEEMLRQYDGVQTAKRLIASGDIQYGLERLAQLGRLDLSMEQVMLSPEYTSLFNQKERDAARWRLSQMRESQRQ